ncbi:cytochrome C oxidase subunit IV family protein [Bradyrhizobium canariense]|uniref:cytochrome C oxidase subunit IV family protein n=1 Tax=Bradyrhizobium canariense TaxID=255045 RepID=UPI000A198B2B|nr:cytochrome C oxidase subunit IV family protein [Bradyrhizobium canariense]OSI24829.1 oxidase [Bradyrhizobium canariense]OSI34321.1 oxidase [Bradyrhizobium canariense]OSI45689.1 oxidase [Bradyrhizobium canariense]OSI48613.1 oxidase [Bradyrhizobium canariense]OSI53658.1 oxidase [Bradyrhizobium canariense]
MTGNRSHPSRSSALWVRNGIIWLALLALLLLSMFLAYIPMGPVTVASGIIVAVIKSSLVVVFFMELIQARALVRLAAVSGLIFLAAMFLLTFADVLTRTGKI